MIVHRVELTVPNASSENFYEFMSNPTDANYQAWWPGQHLLFHVVKRGKQSPLGDEVYYDEWVGRHRLKFHAVVTAADRNQRLLWQMKLRALRLPAWLDMRMSDTPDGVHFVHELRVGLEGWLGAITDPIVGLYITQRFKQDLEAHCHEEWPRLARLLESRKPS